MDCSKIQIVVNYPCCVLIGWATTRLRAFDHICMEKARYKSLIIIIIIIIIIITIWLYVIAQFLTNYNPGQKVLGHIPFFTWFCKELAANLRYTLINTALTRFFPHPPPL